jgi:hypothetical protein
MNQEPDEKILYKEESYAIQGAVFEVYREIGSGFLEAVYQECLAKELKRRGIPFSAQVELFISYKGEKLLQTYTSQRQRWKGSLCNPRNTLAKGNLTYQP